MNSPLEIGVMLVNLGGGLALFLYGMHKMTEALKIVAVFTTCSGGHA